MIEAMQTFTPRRPHTAEWDFAGRGRNRWEQLPRWVFELVMPIAASAVWWR